MGTWDIGFFDNDMACDWENEITTNTNLDYIENALKPVINNKEDSLDIDLANRALAAADALSRFSGKNGIHNSYTEHLDNWTNSYKEEIPKNLLKLAINAIDKVLSPESELIQFWKIRAEYSNWLDIVEQLKDVLNKQYEKETE